MANATGFISNLSIDEGEKCFGIILVKYKKFEYSSNSYNVYIDNRFPLTLPIFGKYDDYGRFYDIDKDDNVKYIEKTFDISIEDFIKSFRDNDCSKGNKQFKTLFKKFEKTEFVMDYVKIYDELSNSYYGDNYSNDFTSNGLLLDEGFNLIEEGKFDFETGYTFQGLTIRKQILKHFCDQSDHLLKDFDKEKVKIYGLKGENNYYIMFIGHHTFLISKKKGDCILKDDISYMYELEKSWNKHSNMKLSFGNKYKDIKYPQKTIKTFFNMMNYRINLIKERFDDKPIEFVEEEIKEYYNELFLPCNGYGSNIASTLQSLIYVDSVKNKQFINEHEKMLTMEYNMRVINKKYSIPLPSIQFGEMKIQKNFLKFLSKLI